MKNALFYYYKFNVDRLIKKNNYYFFENDNYFYYLYPVIRPKEYIFSLKYLNQYLINTKYMEIVFNIFNDIVSLINNHQYILLRQRKEIKFSIDDFFNPYYININNSNLKTFDHSDWYKLFSSKIDYFEYQKSFIKVKYPLLYKTMDYYIGLSENAISYFYACNKYLGKNNIDNLVLSRRRIDLLNDSIYNPLNTVIDNRARDIGEYLKYLFLGNDYDDVKIENFLLSFNFSSYQYSLIMDRLLFPSFYFDLYEEIINESRREEEIIPILKRSGEYESFLKMIYDILNKNQSIMRIDWLDGFN